MFINAYDRTAIKRKAAFLLKQKYKMTETENMITFENDFFSFIVDYERFDNISSMHIFFKPEKASFNLGWIAFVRTGLHSDPHQCLQNVLNLLNYVNKSYEQVTNYQYCKESQKLVEDFISSNLKKK